MVETRYPQAQFFFKDKEIRTGTTKVTRKQDMEDYTASNSIHPYDSVVKSETYEWECSDIDPIYWDTFNEFMDSQLENINDINQLPLAGLYGHTEITGALSPMAILYGAKITEISTENTAPFSVKGTAMKMKRFK